MTPDKVTILSASSLLDWRHQFTEPPGEYRAHGQQL
jgi:hypothetical protein